MKAINSPGDLAINGAPPAFSEPLHVGRPHLGHRERYLQYVNGIFERGWVTNNGPLVQELERRIARHVGVQHCVAMCNGTVALEIAVRALGLTGEVIVPSFTFIATAHALHWQEITPVFADIDPATHNLDPDAVRRMVTPRTTGIIAVNLWGRAAPVAELQAIADEHGLELLFDSAQAFGCSHRGQMLGRYGRAETFSFHATKCVHSFEGGAVVTNEDVLAEKMRLMRNFGFAGYDNVIHPGINGKMPEVCAAMGLASLEALPTVIETNRRNWESYRREFQGLPGISMMRYDPTELAHYHYAVLEVDPTCPATRDQLVEALHAENVLARRYFWPGCHRLSPYRELYPHAGLLLPHTCAVADRVLVLPTGTSIGRDEIATIAAIIRAVVGA